MSYTSGTCLFFTKHAMGPCVSGLGSHGQFDTVLLARVLTFQCRNTYLITSDIYFVMNELTLTICSDAF